MEMLVIFEKFDTVFLDVLEMCLLVRLLPFERSEHVGLIVKHDGFLRDTLRNSSC